MKDSLLRRKYVIPFVLACVILACNQTTGINSIIAYNTNILLQSGLSDFAAHLGYVLFTFINFFVTFAGVMLVDRKGRKFLLSLGTAGIIVSMLCTGILFRQKRKIGSRFPDCPAVDGGARTDGEARLQPGYCGQVAGCIRKSSERRPNFAGCDLFLRRLPGGEPGGAIGRSCGEAHRDLARRLRAGESGERVFLQSFWQSGRGAHGSAEN